MRQPLSPLTVMGVALRLIGPGSRSDFQRGHFWERAGCAQAGLSGGDAVQRPGPRAGRSIGHGASGEQARALWRTERRDGTSRREGDPPIETAGDRRSVRVRSGKLLS